MDDLSPSPDPRPRRRLKLWHLSLLVAVSAVSLAAIRSMAARKLSTTAVIVLVGFGSVLCVVIGASLFALAIAVAVRSGDAAARVVDALGYRGGAEVLDRWFAVAAYCSSPRSRCGPGTRASSACSGPSASFRALFREG